jgi:cell division transport system ATP-binding protein
MGVAFDQEGAPVAAVAAQVDSIPAPVEAEPAAQVAVALDAVVPSLDAEPLMTATPQVAQAAQVPVSAVPGVNPGAVQAEQVFAQAPSVVVQTAGFSAEAGAAQEDPTAQAGYTSVFAPLAPQANEDTSHINRNGTPVISLKHVTKIYPAQPNKPALEDVSLDIYPGEFVFLVGHSGSGKSTFLKLLTRELRATSGEVNVAGQNLTNMRNWKVPYLRRQIGCVFQDFKLLPDKTTYENVAFTLECIGKPRSVVRAQVPEVLRLVGLGEKMDMYPDQLSGGEQQRVSVARAMVNRPPLLICDEPTGNLDPAISLGIMKLLERINRTGTTVLMATHDREMVDSMRKRVIALEAGHLVRDQERGGYGYYGAL